MQSFSPKDPAEVVVLSFDFAALKEDGETVEACVFTAVDRQYGQSPSTTMIQGVADYAQWPVVKQMVRGGKDGHNYVIAAKVTLSSGRVLVGPATLPVRDGA